MDLFDLSDDELRGVCRSTRVECVEHVVARQEMEVDHESVQARIARLLAGKGMR